MEAKLSLYKFTYKIFEENRYFPLRFMIEDKINAFLLYMKTFPT